MADPHRDWNKDGKGRPYYTVYKHDDQPASKPQGTDWNGIQYEKKRDMGVHALGSTKGRNLISTAIQFFLDWAEMDARDREIAELFRYSLFNCNPLREHKVRKAKHGTQTN